MKRVLIICLALLCAPCLAEQIHVRAEDVQYDPGTEQVVAVGDAHFETEDYSISGQSISYDYGKRVFAAEGGVKSLHQGVTLTADRLEGSDATGDVKATGSVVFTSESRTLIGDSFTYNYKTEHGLATDARASSGGLYFKGAELASEPGLYTIKKARLTGCDREEHPHYYLSAREMVIEPGKELVAKNVSLFLGGMKILYLPKYSVGLGEGGGGSKLPIIGASEESGLFTGYEFDLGSGERTTGGLAVRLSAREVLQAGLMYDRIDDKPIFVRMSYRMPFYGGARPYLLVSRLPEVGVRFTSEPRLEGSREPLNLFSGSFEKVSDGKPKIEWAAEASIGRFAEEPTDVSENRLDARVTAWLTPIPIGKRTCISPGVVFSTSRYGDSSYDVLGFRVTLARQFAENLYGELSFAERRTSGETPFDFDRVELSRELSGRVQFPVGDFLIGVGGRYDLRGGEFFDAEYSLGKTFHCLQPEISWRKREKELSFNLKLVGM
ncbi:MAG: hypothetical protein ACYC2Y_01040 [Armatimonadota bacterium]